VVVSRRFVVFGAGAVGGVIAACLRETGFDVTAIARGEHLTAMRRDGLTVRRADGTSTVRLPVVEGPGEVEWAEDDVVVMAVKSQDTEAAFNDLAAAAPPTVVVVCAQNGVANERMALRRFANTVGMCVVLDATHLTPGVVEVESSYCPGILDIGRYPNGSDRTVMEIAGALRTATFESLARADIMRWKYAKLLHNLGNAVEAICGPQGGDSELLGMVRQEGEVVLSAAGIGHVSAAEMASRGDLVSIRPVNGRKWEGGSSWQSLRRGAGTIEADYLNGEIVLLGRLFGAPTPANSLVQKIANRMARDRVAPGAMAERELLAQLEACAPGPLSAAT
jgi:2-dehydropantoate 2-reductase